MRAFVAARGSWVEAPAEKVREAVKAVPTLKKQMSGESGER